MSHTNARYRSEGNPPITAPPANSSAPDLYKAADLVHNCENKNVIFIPIYNNEP